MKIPFYKLYQKLGGIFLLTFLMTAIETINKGLKENAQAVGIQQLVHSTLSKQQKMQPVIENTQNKIALTGDKLSLEQIHAYAQQEQNEITRGIKKSTESDKFTQSQAHMSLPEIKKLIAAEYNIKPYQKMIDAILDREKQNKDDCYVFYHGMKNEWRVSQDLYTELYLYSRKLSLDLKNDFVFLRFAYVNGPTPVQTFLINKLKENGLINDHQLGDFLLSANLALFGNVGNQPECTWQYFMKARKSSAPTREIYETILRAFGISEKYADSFMALESLYKTEQQTIVQLFIPKDKVDEIGYLSWIRGIPAHKKTMEVVWRSLENKKFEKSPQALDHYTGLFRREQEQNPIFGNLLERVKADDFKLGYFLHFYCNHPELIEGINHYQARLIFTTDVLLNPLSGVKIYRYATATPDQLQNYQKKFNTIFKKMIAEKEKNIN